MPAEAEHPLRAPTPVVEPTELLRISTLQLIVVIARRARQGIMDRIAGPFRRRR